MTLEEFERDWKKYAIVGRLGKRPNILALRNVFSYYRKSGNGLIFCAQNGISCFWHLNCDEVGNCYRQDNEVWSKIGRLILLEELEKNPKYLRRLKRCERLFWMSAGGY